VVAVAIACAVLVAWYGRRMVVASATVSGSVVTARDAAGREVWARDFAPKTPSAFAADIVGNGESEVVVGLFAENGQPSAAQDLLVFGGRGEQFTAIASADRLLAWPYDSFSDVIAGAQPYAVDLDGDHRPELAWITHHRWMYPAVVGAWNPRAGLRPGPLLINSGHLDALLVADLDGDGSNELVLKGQNNPLGYQVVVAVVKPRRAPRDIYASSASPDLVSAWESGVRGGRQAVVSYTPLGPRDGEDVLLDASAAGVSLRVRGEAVRLDADGNPAGSLLFGRGRQPRQKLWDDLTRLCRVLESGRDSERIGALRAAHSAVLTEAPMRLAADLLLARSLAIGGDHRAAIELLRGAVADLPDDRDLRLRLGEQLGIAGERRAAMTALERASQVGTAGRSPFDAELAWLTVAAIETDVGESQGAFAAIRSAVSADDPARVGENSEYLALLAFCRGDWGNGALRAGKVDPVLEFAAVLRAWAELERGGDATRAANAAETLASNPEIRDLSRILQAHALVRIGRPDDARTLAAKAVESLALGSQTDFRALVWLALGHWVAGEAAAALGDQQGAAAEYSDAAAIAPKCWFGRPPHGQR